MAQSFRYYECTPRGTAMNLFLAYIDPGTSGLMIQMLIGGVAGVVAFLKYRTKNLFGRNSTTASGDDQAADEVTQNS